MKTTSKNEDDKKNEDNFEKYQSTSFMRKKDKTKEERN